jgi:hypothetical protein
VKIVKADATTPMLSASAADALLHSPEGLQPATARRRESDRWLRRGVFEVGPNAPVVPDVAPKARRDTRKQEAIRIQTAPAQQLPIEEQIRMLAYQFFEERGFEHGHDVEDWIRAEEIVLARVHATELIADA